VVIFPSLLRFVRIFIYSAHFLSHPGQTILLNSTPASITHLSFEANTFNQHLKLKFTVFTVASSLSALFGVPPCQSRAQIINIPTPISVRFHGSGSLVLNNIT
jgi:hypothetical protein